MTCSTAMENVLQVKYKMHFRRMLEDLYGNTIQSLGACQYLHSLLEKPVVCLGTYLLFNFHTIQYHNYSIEILFFTFLFRLNFLKGATQRCHNFGGYVKAL
jgi:hypothetical protein